MATIPLPKPTNNPVPSTDIRDHVYAGAKLDEAMTSANLTFVDRKGITKKTWKGFDKAADKAIAGFGYITLDSFEDGATITLPSQILRWKSNGEYYRWDGEYPSSGKVVPAGSTPESSGGIGQGKWLSVGAAALSSSQDGAGDALISVKQPFPDSVIVTQHDKNAEFVTVKDAGAIGDGNTNDSEAFSLYETWFTGRDVDLRGLTYAVSSIPTGNRYFNGNFTVAGVIHNANYVLGRNVNNVVTTIGNSGGSIPSDYALPEINRFTYRNGSFAAGGALNSATAAGQTVAIGADAMGNTLKSFSNIAIGEVSLQNVQSLVDAYSTTDVQGTRNVAIGDNTMQFLTTGWNNVAIGRNAAVCSVNVVGQVAIGNGALGGIGENGWYSYIENFCPNSSGQTYNVAIGQGTASVYQGMQLTAIGGDAGKTMRKGAGNSLFGRQSGSKLESLVGLNGKSLTTLNASATYVKTGNNMVITIAGHNTVAGGYIAILPTSGPADVSHNHVFPCLVTAVSGDSVTVQCPYVGDGSGNVTVGWTVSATDGVLSQTNTALGDHSLMNATVANNMVATGNRAAQNVITGTDSVVVGSRAAQNSSAVSYSVMVGQDAGNNATVFTNCTAIGWESLRRLQDYTIASALTNAAGIGYNARVSGSNQLQLGDSATAVYANAALQVRSDSRDKAEVRDTVLGIDFIMGLRPVMGKWNYRDDYYIASNVQVGIDEEAQPIYETRYTFDEASYLAKTKMRTREHNWFIAQEVQELCNKLGIDFAGLHHAQVNGGADVYTIGYEEFIPPLASAIQSCWKKLQSIEERLAALEGK